MNQCETLQQRNRTEWGGTTSVARACVIPVCLLSQWRTVRSAPKIHIDRRAAPNAQRPRSKSIFKFAITGAEKEQTSVQLRNSETAGDLGGCSRVSGCLAAKYTV